MALLDSKQLNPNLTGSFILSGSTQTFIGASDFQGSITASGDISGSYTSTGSLGFLNVDGNAQIDGNTNIDGNITLGGNITVGDSDSDSISFGADISSSLIPDVNDKYNIGSDSKRWNDFYLSGSVSASGGPHHITSDTTIDLDAEGALTLDGGSITIGGDTDVAVDIDSTTLDIDASGALTIDSATSISIGTTVDKPIDIDSTTLDIDASGALTLDSATSISIGTTADKPIDIDSTTLDIDASGAITIDGTSTILISGDGGATFSDDTEALVYDGSGNVDFDTVALDIDSSGAITIDGTSTFSVDVDGTTNINTSVGDLTLQSEASSVIIEGSKGVNLIGALTGSSNISASGDLSVTGNLDIDGTSNLASDLFIGGNITGSNDISASGNLSVTGNLDIDGTSNLEGDVTLQNDLSVTGNITGSGNISGSYLGTGSFSRLEAVGNSNLIGHLTIGSDLSAPTTATASFGLLNSTTHIATTVESLTFACFTLISGSAVSTGSFGRVVVDNGISDNFIIDDGKVSGSFTTTGSFGRLEIAGNANIDGDITLGGDITIGDSTGDSISFTAEISSSLVPDADATYDLGSSSKGWNDLHLGSGGIINLDGGDVTLTHSSNLVTITGGTTRVDKLEIDGANDHIDVSTDMVLTAAADITLTPGGANVKPGSDSAIDLGVSGTAFRELFVDAIDLNGQGSISVGGTGRIDLDGDDDTSIRASADDIITFEAGAVDIAQMTTTMAVSGSSISTGSFGYVNVDGMSTPSLSEYSSSIATQLNTLTADVIALSIALG